MIVLRCALEATNKKAIVWQNDLWHAGQNGDCFTAKFDGREIVVRFLYFEATNQVGADRHSMQLSMPGLSAFFAAGTEGYNVLLEVFSAAFDSWAEAHGDTGEYALEYLDKAMSSLDQS